MKRLVRVLPCLTAIALIPYLHAESPAGTSAELAAEPSAIGRPAPAGTPVRNQTAVAELAAFAAGVNPGPVTIAEPAYAAVQPLRSEAERAANRAAYRAWKRSLIPLAVSQGLDIASSYGMRELNPGLAGADGRFGMKAVAIKGGATAAIVGVEYLLAKKYPKAARVLSKLNWSSSVLTSAFAVHNFMIK